MFVTVHPSASLATEEGPGASRPLTQAHSCLSAEAPLNRSTIRIGFPKTIVQRVCGIRHDRVCNVSCDWIVRQWQVQRRTRFESELLGEQCDGAALDLQPCPIGHAQRPMSGIVQATDSVSAVNSPV